MTLTAKFNKGLIVIAASTTLAACDSLVIIGDSTGSSLDIGAAQSLNLLDQGAFDGDFGDWQACSDPTAVKLNTASDGTQSGALLSAGGCIFQSVPASANDNMVVTCSARKSTNDWASVTFGFLDENFQPLNKVETPIPTGSNLTNLTAALNAPIDTAFAEVILFAEDGAIIDNCQLVNASEGAPTELLLNPYFEEELNGWHNCSGGIATVDDDTATLLDGCIRQQFTAVEGNELTLSCDGYRTGDSDWAAVALGFLDADLIPVEVSETGIPAEQGTFPTVTLTAPATTGFAEVIVYSQGEAHLNNCSLIQIENPAEDPEL